MTLQLDQHLIKAGITADDLIEIDGDLVRDMVEAHGYKRSAVWKLLTDPERGNAKAVKASDYGYMQFIHHLHADRVDVEIRPRKTESVVTCPHATHGEGGCAESCLTFSGRGVMPSVQAGRAKRTTWLTSHPLSYLAALWQELVYARNISVKRGLRMVVRLNGTSDLRWELIAPWLFSEFPDTLFIDYTKWPPGSRTTPENYTLVWSAQAHRHTIDDWHRALDHGMSVSAIFDYPEMAVEQRPDVFVAAYGADTWVLDCRDNPRVGVLRPLRPLTRIHPSVYQTRAVLEQLEE